MVKQLSTNERASETVAEVAGNYGHNNVRCCDAAITYLMMVIVYLCAFCNYMQLSRPVRRHVWR